MKKRKKGFTLIELMIVLAVIAILAIVLVPKIGSTKKEARNAGVTTNVRAVQAYLENKLDSYNGTLPDADDLASKLHDNFTDDKSMVNPFNKSADFTYKGETSAAADPCVYVTTDTTYTSDNCKGTVVVEIDNTDKTFTIIGVDGDGAELSTTVVK